MDQLSNKIIKIFFILTLVLLPSSFCYAKDIYPKLSNYYLKYFSKSDYEELYRWDLIITPAEMTYHNNEFFQNYKKRQPSGILLFYIYPAMIDQYDLSEPAGWHKYLYNEVEKNNWWLRDGKGNKIQVWPNIYAVNVTKPGWQDFNARYAKMQLDSGKWDGMMFDMVDASITHYSYQNGIDVNGDGRADDPAFVNQQWQAGMAQLFAKTRNLAGDKKIMINGNSISCYQPNINGRMFESFPTPWEGNGQWSYVMDQYLNNLPAKNKEKNIYVINSNTNNTGNKNNFKQVRYGLTSTLLGNGFFSYDYGDSSHAQNWWYDEYNVYLGREEIPAYNLLNKTNNTIQAGLWRRDFEKGVAIVNSTNKEQTYIFPKEEMERIKGSQDPAVNNGQKVNYVKLASNDGIILLKKNIQIYNTSFKNGSFARIFNDRGAQVRNGFFTYQDNIAAGMQVMYSNLDNEDGKEIITISKGKVSVLNNGKKWVSFYPFGNNYNKEINIYTTDLNNDNSKELFVAAGAGGGPMIRYYDQNGKLLNGGFFAYDKNFRGGVNIAVGDLTGDGIKEVITAPGKGGGPQIRIFTNRGKLLSGGFFAYDKNFRGGVSVAVGDVNGDGKGEIITIPQSGGGPQVKIFNSQGKLLKSFFAYDKNLRLDLKVATGNIDNNTTEEIFVINNNY